MTASTVVVIAAGRAGASCVICHGKYWYCLLEKKAESHFAIAAALSLYSSAGNTLLAIMLQMPQRVNN